MKKLLNPFALVFEGFVLGACLFMATGGLDEQVQAPAGASEAVSTQA